MTHVIAEHCVGTWDTGCVHYSPVDCIHAISADQRCYIAKNSGRFQTHDTSDPVRSRTDHH